MPPNETCPRRIFHDDFLKQLTQWREQGDRLIVCMDANEHIYKKSMGKSLTGSQSLVTKEVVGSFTNEPLGATFFRGPSPFMEFGLLQILSSYVLASCHWATE